MANGSEESASSQLSGADVSEVEEGSSEDGVSLVRSGSLFCEEGAPQAHSVNRLAAARKTNRKRFFFSLVISPLQQNFYLIFYFQQFPRQEIERAVGAARIQNRKHRLPVEP